MKKSIKCYNTKKAVEESNDLYTKKVSNCFAEVRKYQKSSVKDLIESMQIIRNLEVFPLIFLYLKIHQRDCDKRKLHCSNLISEAEISLCQETEFSKYVDDYGNHMRNFIHLYESKYSKFKNEF